MNTIGLLFIAPAFKTISSKTDNDTIILSWTLEHTGGFLTNSITFNGLCSPSVTFNDIYDISGSGDNENSSSNTQLQFSCQGNDSCFTVDTLTGIISVGPVYAGISYDCIIRVTNSLGMDFESVYGVISKQGNLSYFHIYNML